MKKTISILLITVCVASAAKSQFTEIGGGAAFSTGFKFHNTDYEYNKSGNFAAMAKGIYKIAPLIDLSPSFTFFYPNITRESNRKTTISSMMLDINCHYNFTSSGKFVLYGIAGFDILLAWKKDIYTGSDPFRESDNAMGLNAGAGARMNITGNLDLFGEVKYILSKYDQLMVNAGILIKPDWLKTSGRKDN